jgi:hypothetical protein
MLDDPFAQQVGIDAMHQRQARQRDARFEAGLDQRALGLRIIATLAGAIDAGDRQRSNTNPKSFVLESRRQASQATRAQ